MSGLAQARQLQPERGSALPIRAWKGSPRPLDGSELLPGGMMAKIQVRVPGRGPHVGQLERTVVLGLTEEAGPEDFMISRDLIDRPHQPGAIEVALDVEKAADAVGIADRTQPPEPLLLRRQP